ncbi:MAG TPA: DNA methyltransferase [Bacilli bacterium]|nr:DNA methyltransferase [Bacilli bacterium]
MNIEIISINKIKLNPSNPRTIKDDKFNKLVKSIKEFPEMLKIRPIVVNDDLVVLGGNMRLKACKEAGLKEIPIIKASDLTEEQQREFIIKDNVGYGEWDFALLTNDYDLDLLTDWGLDMPDMDNVDNLEIDQKPKKLSDSFIIPPFSVLNTAQGIWQQRKNWWLNLGIKSEEGRDAKLFSKGCQPPAFYNIVNELRSKGLDCSLDAATKECQKRGIKLFGDENGSFSIFDPVLCELSYKWFCIESGKILDPFAGGSVRGIVASILDYDYFGNDLRAEQIEANIINAKEVLPDGKKMPKWTVGDSLNIDKIAGNYEADLVFSCPPYADLEVYSDLKEDISNMSYSEFLNIYRQIIKKSCDLLKDDRFAVFVVGDVRDKNGAYRNFVSDTIQAFIDCGLMLYNEMILVNNTSSLSTRARKYFQSRKIGKHHQNVLVFYKGNPKNIKNIFKEIDLSYLDEYMENTEDVE